MKNYKESKLIEKESLIISQKYFYKLLGKLKLTAI